MTTYQSNTILKEVNNLIIYSCRSRASKFGHFDPIHRAIIKKHFNAFDVVIHEDRQEIDLKIEAKEKNYVGVSFKCLDLEAFLKSCIEKDRTSLAFYQHMLMYYNVVGMPN